MKRIVLAALALMLVIGLQPQAARAGSPNTACDNGFISWLNHGQDCHLFYGGVGIGIGTGIGIGDCAHHLSAVLPVGCRQAGSVRGH